MQSFEKLLKKLSLVGELKVQVGSVTHHDGADGP